MVSVKTVFGDKEGPSRPSDIVAGRWCGQSEFVFNVIGQNSVQELWLDQSASGAGSIYYDALKAFWGGRTVELLLRRWEIP